MKEIEVKAHASMALKEAIESYTGVKGESVEKDDLYLRRPGENVQALRIRNNNGTLEITAKKTSLTERSEDNLEYELFLTLKQRDEAISFFKHLGFIEYFRKHKKGYSWQLGPLHAELFEVNDLGAFLELEVLLDYSSDEKAVRDAEDMIYAFIDHFDLGSSIERKSYREMILNGIQS